MRAFIISICISLFCNVAVATPPSNKRTPKDIVLNKNVLTVNPGFGYIKGNFSFNGFVEYERFFSSKNLFSVALKAGGFITGPVLMFGGTKTGGTITKNSSLYLAPALRFHLSRKGVPVDIAVGITAPFGTIKRKEETKWGYGRIDTYESSGNFASILGELIITGHITNRIVFGGFINAGTILSDAERKWDHGHEQLIVVAGLRFGGFW